MPLNQLRKALGPDPVYPQTPDAVPLLSRLKYDEKLHPAFASVFRRCMVVRNLEVGAPLARQHGLECVTMDGDRAGASGAMTGGHIDMQYSRVQAFKEMGDKSTASSASIDECEASKQAAEQAQQAFIQASIALRRSNSRPLSWVVKTTTPRVRSAALLLERCRTRM